VEEPNAKNAMTQHLEHLAADADDVFELLTRQHEAGGDLHPEALPKAARLRTSLHDVLQEVSHHEHLAMGADDVWQALTRKHYGREV
jgi:hypothetical protein